MIKNKLINIKRHNLFPDKVKSGMCVYPKYDISKDGVDHKQGEPYIIMTAQVQYYKDNCQDYIWQEIKQA